MQQKILVASNHEEDREALEEILGSFLQKGGELIFAKKRAEALMLMKQEIPQILFLDNSFVGDCNDWVQEKTHVILMRNIEDNSMHGEDFVDRPLKPDQVLEKCRATLESLTALRLPPM